MSLEQIFESTMCEFLIMFVDPILDESQDLNKLLYEHRVSIT